MKKVSIFAAMMMLAAVLASCGKTDYTAFIGTWGVERIDYYNLDFFGEPIPATVETYHFTPGDMDNGIDLVFRADKTGEMRDRSRDTLKLDWNDSLHIYETVIVCPDTTLVTKFTYSYDADDGILYMNMQVTHPFTYRMQIDFLAKDRYEYINEYDVTVEEGYSVVYVEKAMMVRYSTETRGNRAKPVYMKRHPGSFFSR